MAKSDKDGFKRRLAEMAAETGATRQEWADVCHCSPQAAQGWLKTGTISEANRKRLAAHYGYSDIWLQTGYGPKQNLNVVQKRIRDMMNRNGLYSDDLELLTRGKVRAETVDRWLEGRADPTDTELKAIAPHLGMPPDYFRTGISTVRHHGGPDRHVIEMPEGYAEASPEARRLAETILRMSAAGETDERQLAAISELLKPVRHHPGIDESVVEAVAQKALAEIEAEAGGRLTGHDREYELDRLRQEARRGLQGNANQEKGEWSDQGAPNTQNGS
ncbi:MAG: hypothetical protein K9M17_05415 [Mariprofundaceae bacterium]|nr:hypothetical protein [Mariprofundaceae bacterium]